MGRLITVEQAVEAVRRCSKNMLIGQIEYVVDALRALPPAEATEEEVVEGVVEAIRASDMTSPCTESDTALRWRHARAAIAAMRGGR